MTDVTLKLLADEIQTSVDRLLQQFSGAGIQKSANDLVTMQEKQILLTYLNRKHSLVPDKLTLKRKTHSTLNIPGIDGKNKPVKIEIRKLRTFINRDSQKSGSSCILQGQKNYGTQEKVCHEEKLKSEREIIENKKCSVIKKKEISNHQINDFSKITMLNLIHQEGKTNKKSEPIKSVHKIEKKIHHTSEKNKKINDVVSTKDINHHMIHSKHIHKTKNEDNYEVKNDFERNQNIKHLRLNKKGNKNFELKFKHEATHATIHTKISRNKNFNLLHQEFHKPSQAVNRDIVIGETITVGELANKMAVKSSQVIKTMIKLGTMATINQILDQETAQLVADEMGYEVILCRENRLEEELMNDRDVNFISEPRAPVVTIMGHVDHGKTSLIDYIRSTRTASNEAGGITQRIGAYHVNTENGIITFLDTPGHAAFTAMRARGIQVTDIIVLVVAADDGVMPQTIEAIHHAKTAQLPVVVAINKIDKSESDPDRVKNELAQHGILSEEWGGDCQFVHVSAKIGIGIDKLLSAILVQAEVLELKAVRKGMARGAVIESSLDRGRGPVATVLVREGTLNKGDIVLCGFEYGRIRAMRNELNHDLTKVGPSIPVEILGLSGVPIAGDEFTVVRDEKKAREVALYRQGKFREVKLAHQQKSKLENIFVDATQNKVHEINIILKGDVQGSVEALSDSLIKLSNDNIKIKVIGSGVGSINETDAILATASKAILIGFNVHATSSARHIIEAENLDLRYHSIIYKLVDEIKILMKDILFSDAKRQTVGLAEVRNIFKTPKFGIVAGCIVVKGIIKKQNSICILRNNVVIYKGEIDSLRHFKDDVNTVRNGMECGISVRNYNDVHVGDMIEVFETY